MPEDTHPSLKRSTRAPRQPVVRTTGKVLDLMEELKKSLAAHPDAGPPTPNGFQTESTVGPAMAATEQALGGRFIIVRHGVRGQQTAYVYSDLGHRLRVRKWCASPRRWTNVVIIDRAAYLCPATTEEIARTGFLPRRGA